MSEKYKTENLPNRSGQAVLPQRSQEFERILACDVGNLPQLIIFKPIVCNLEQKTSTL